MRTSSSLRSAARVGTSFVLWASIGFIVGCGEETQDAEPGDPLIGVLLPFTGLKAAPVTSYERAMLMAVEQVNSAGGINGRMVHLVSRDTRSDPDTALRATEELVDEIGVKVLIGPLDPAAASASRWYSSSRNIAHVLPGIMPLAIQPTGFVRLAPTSERVGCVLAERLVKDGISRAEVLYQRDTFHESIAKSMVDAFSGIVSQGKSADVGTLAIDADQYSYQDAIQSVSNRLAEAVVLVADPTVAARIVQTWATSGLGVRWYLGPLLDNEAFLANIPTGSLEGVVGVASSPRGFTDDFAAAYRATWLGDEPASGAHEFYDAVNVTALGMAAQFYGQRNMTDTSSRSLDLTHYIKIASEPPGVGVPWTQVGRGLDALSRGEDIDYSGITGPVDLGDTALYWGYSALVGFWSVSGTKAVYEEKFYTGTTCGQ